MKTLDDIVEYLDSINDRNDLRYDDCIGHAYINKEWYEEILKLVLNLDEKPKRIIDIGSNMNQYAYLFNNEGIDYIGIDLWNANRYMKPYENKNSKFIGADYRDIKEFFKDDVIISCLCVGYLIPVNEVKAKHFIMNSLELGKPSAKLLW